MATVNTTPARCAAIGLTWLISACAAAPHPTNASADAVQAPANVKLATKPAATQEVAAVAQNRIVVTFPTGGTTLSPDADKQLDLAARLFRDANPVAMFVAGHADVTGDEYQNVIISAKRAEVVKRALVERGIAADRLLIQAYGASEPANSSDPQSPDNRRAVITWRLL
jgi:outer membrane protein OmpA-like peptidoglycan-associated protein